jgi:hypothetical protein
MHPSYPGTVASWHAMLFLWLATGIAWADYPLEIIDLRHRPAEELVPLLAPMTGPGGSVAGQGAHLFVRADPKRMEDIRRLLATLDQPLRSLLIQVRGETDAIGEGSRVGGPGGLAVRSGGRQRALVQEVRTIEGRSAFIAEGTERPEGWREVGIGPDGPYQRRGIGYRRAESGFYVLPRVVGDQVTLEIAASDADTGPGADPTPTAGLSTTVTGRLGEWIPLGSVDEDASHTSIGTWGLGESRLSASRGLAIRVTELP